jgi:hypothetical protein
VSTRKTIAKVVADLNAQALYPFGTQPINCPSSVGHAYSLTFYYPVRRAESVQVEADACRIVQEKGRHLRWTLPLRHQVFSICWRRSCRASRVCAPRLVVAINPNPQ